MVDHKRGFPDWACVEIDTPETIKRLLTMQPQTLRRIRLDFVSSKKLDRLQEVLGMDCIRRLKSLTIDHDDDEHEDGGFCKIFINQIGVEGAKIIAEAKNLEGLEELDLMYSNIGDDGVATLAASPALSNLKHLVLAHNSIGADGLRAIINSPHFRQLEYLDVEFNPLSDEVVEEARKKLSNCKIRRMLHKELQEARCKERKSNEVEKRPTGLTTEEYQSVRGAHYSEQDYQDAFKLFGGGGLPQHSIVEQAARLLAVFRDDERGSDIEELLAQTYSLLAEQ